MLILLRDTYIFYKLSIGQHDEIIEDIVYSYTSHLKNRIIEIE